MRVISVTGGKGGVGKTTVSINLAIELAKSQNVVLFDADMGLANVDVLLGIKSKFTMGDYLDGRCQFDDLCLTGPHGLRIIPADSGVQKYSELDANQSAQVITSFSKLSGNVDTMIVDLASGISRQVIDFTNASQNIMLVICNDPASLMDSYAVIKILYQTYGRNNFGIIVNKTNNQNEGYNVFCRFQDTIHKFIDISLNYMGSIPDDESIKLAARSQVALVDKFQSSLAAQAFKEISRNIQMWHTDNNLTGGMQFFFERIIQSNKMDTELCTE